MVGSAEKAVVAEAEALEETGAAGKGAAVGVRGDNRDVADFDPRN
jgi:hypothetical protein